MAVIGKIRQQSGLLIILIGASLILFLLGDYFTSGGGAFSQSDNVVGIIGDDEIAQRDFDLRVEQMLNEQYGAEGATEQARKSARERVWQMMISERILHKEYDMLGVAYSPYELREQVENPQPGSILYQYFTDPQTGQVLEQFRNEQTGMLDGSKVASAIRNLLASEQKADWLPIENAIKEDLLMNKYTSMVRKGIYVTTAEARQMASERDIHKDVSYALKEFMTINDEDVEVSNADLQAYFEKHKHEKAYQSEQETREILVAIFDIQPSEQDLSELRGELEALKAGFAADSNDTVFVAENAESDYKSLITYMGEQKLPAAIRDTAMKAEIGAVFGPYPQGSAFRISKIIGMQMSPDSVEASHILISVRDGDTTKIAAAKTLLDSLKTVAESKKNFADLAREFSEDGSASKGGELGMFGRGAMVAPFEKACFEGKPGDHVIVESQFGVHLIHITKQTALKKRLLVASIDRAQAPSSNTINEFYRQAIQFRTTHTDLASFEAETSMPIQPIGGIRMGEDQIGLLGEAKEVVRWTYEVEQGAVSDPIELEDRFVVAVVKSVYPKGQMSFENATALIRPEVIREKKAEKFIAEFGSYTTIAEAATNAGVSVVNAANLQFSNNALPGGLGREPRLTGTVAALQPNVVSKPIVGIRGVYVVVVTGENVPEAPEDVSLDKLQAAQQLTSSVDRVLYQALQDAVGVEDMRGRFY